MSARLDSVLFTYTNSMLLSDEAQIVMARQNIFDSLHFPQIRERESQVQQTHNKTYQWIPSESYPSQQRWDGFVPWLQSPNPRYRIYWVHGKIGAGKTTLLRFLYGNIIESQHMEPWRGSSSVIRANCFFWSPGNSLQKSTVGLLRTLLTQLFQQKPDYVSRLVPTNKWQTASLTGSHVIEWTEPELRDCLREYVILATRSCKIFLLIDGLDEFEGTGDAQEELIDLLVSLADNENLKICVSSRPWNIFRDAFGQYPQLRLEDLTHNDISSYIREQLHANRMFVRLQQHEPDAAERLDSELIQKAAGVFLWVRLVVKQLLLGLRDGDGILRLQEKVEQIPADLDDCFMRLVESIEPHNRREASELLQFALHEETEFTTLHSQHLLEFSFIEEGQPNFALKDRYQLAKFDVADIDVMTFRIESALRKLNSRCMGLLECNIDLNLLINELEASAVALMRGDSQSKRLDSPDSFAEGLASDWTDPQLTHFTIVHASGESEPMEERETQLDRITRASRQPVLFLHRSLHDFLLILRVQTLLHTHTNGSYDSRMFIRCARLVELLSLHRSWYDFAEMVGLTSYIISTLTVTSFRRAPEALQIANMLQPVVEDLGQQYHENEKSPAWYISAPLDRWTAQESSFLSFAIDLGLTAYVEANLTPENVLNKKGRPLLDYVLQPEFASEFAIMSVGNQVPDFKLVESLLAMGADPNAQYQQSSIWARFLCFTVDNFAGVSRSRIARKKPFYAETIKQLIKFGADLLVPQVLLTDIAEEVEVCNDVVTDQSLRCDLEIRSIPQVGRSTISMYAISDVLQFLVKKHKLDLESLKTSVMEQEARIFQEISLTHLEHQDTAVS